MSWGVVAASLITTTVGVVQSERAKKEQKEDVKDANQKALLSEREEKKKQLLRERGQNTGGYGSTLGAGASSLGG
jgi:hypothetical protein